jgi:hypothetical protein
MSNNSIYDYVKNSVAASLQNPPDTEFLRGYLASLLVLAEEALGFNRDTHPFAEAHKFCFTAQYRATMARRDLARCFRQVEELIDQECER